MEIWTMVIPHSQPYKLGTEERERFRRFAHRCVYRIFRQLEYSYQPSKGDTSDAVCHEFQYQLRDRAIEEIMPHPACHPSLPSIKLSVCCPQVIVGGMNEREPSLCHGAHVDGFS
jgi:hypothetical protein